LWLVLVLLWTVPVGWLVIYAAMQDAPKASISVAYCPQADASEVRNELLRYRAEGLDQSWRDVTETCEAYGSPVAVTVGPSMPADRFWRSTWMSLAVAFGPLLLTLAVWVAAGFRREDT
jgi:ABC-type glycerol-3-phosphate transport system permease component